MTAFIVLAGLTLTTQAVAQELRLQSLARYGVGHLKSRAGLPVQALKSLEVAQKTAPDQPAPKAELVKLYRQLGRPAAALRLAQEVVASDPADHQTARRLAQLLMEVNRAPEAVATLNLALESPRLTDKLVRQALLDDLAAAAERATDWKALERAAIERLKLLSDADERDRVLRQLGRAHEEQGDFAQARECYQKSTAAPVKRAWLLSGVLMREGRAAEALVELDKVLAQKPAVLAPYERLAALLKQANRAAEVVPALDRHAGLNPAVPGIAWMAAEQLAATDPDAAWERFRLLAQQDVSAGLAAKLVGVALATGHAGDLLDLVDATAVAARAGRSEDEPGGPRDEAGRRAVSRFRTLVAAVKRHPDPTPLFDEARPGTRHEETRNLLLTLAERAGRADVLKAVAAAGSGGNPARQILALFRAREWEKALDLCDELESAPPRRGPVPFYDYYRAEALYNLGRVNEALQALDAAAQVGMDQGVVKLRKATILAETGRAQQAVTLCEQVIADDPKPAQRLDARLHLATALAALGRFAESDRQYDLARDLDPDSALVWNNYGYNLADQGRRLEDAERMLRHAVQLARDESARLGAAEPTRGTYLDSLAWALFRRGKLEESKQLFDEAVLTADAHNDPIVWDHRGDVYARLNQDDEARKSWAKAVALYADTAQGRQDGRRAEAERKLGTR